MIFTERLSVLLKAKRVSRKTLSRATGIKYSTICSWYVRKSNRINMVTMQKLSLFFGIDVSFLMSASVNENRLLRELDRNREIFSNVKTDQLMKEIESLKDNPDITELDIQIAKTTASLDTGRKAQLFLLISHFKSEIEDGNDVMVSVGPIIGKKQAIK